MIRLRRLQPDTVRGIRHWAIELAVVAVGVLLALWAAEWASERNARKSAAIAAEAMDSDLMYMALGTMRRFSTQPCVEESFANLRRSLSVSDGEPFVPPPVAKLSTDEDRMLENYHPAGVWNYPTQAFDRAVALGAFDHMEPMRATYYAAAYDWVRNLQMTNNDEMKLIARLSMLELVERMNAPTRLALSETIAELDGHNQTMLNSGRFLFDLMDKLGIEPTDADREEWRGYNEAARAVRGDCVVDLPLDFTGAATGKRWDAEIER